MDIKEIEILNLLDSMEDIEEVSQWIWEEWSKERGCKLEDIIYRSKHSLTRNDIPQMYIAKRDEEVIGVASLWRNDLTARQDLYPWMATLIVKPTYRGQGIGKMLQSVIIAEARRLGYPYLYLITELVGYYEKSGWEFMEEAPLEDGEYVRVYRYKL